MKDNKCFLTLDETITKDYKLSEYNLYLDESKGIVFNTLTQAVALFEDKIIRHSEIPELLENGFIVNKEENEFEIIKAEYDKRDQFSNKLHLIIATTLDCQFRCFYCYEEHPKVYMKSDIKRAIIELVKKYASEGKDISIVWYGGEPLLDFETVKELTYQFKKICDTNRVSYEASMISNGFQFDSEKISILDELNIDSIQITIDGIKEIHEMRRPTIDGSPSFDRIIENIIEINNASKTKVHLRINVDKSNIKSAHELLVYCAQMGLTNIDVNLGLMKEFGCDHSCANAKNNLFNMKEFSEEFVRFKKHAKELGFFTAIKKMYPEYKINSCTMDAPNAYVIDPYGYVYKCISLVGKKELSIGSVQEGFDINAHNSISPFDNKLCCNCKYFPICKGGCLLKNSSNSRECNVWKYITDQLVIEEIT